MDIDDEGGGGPSSPASHDGRTPNTARGGGMSSRRGAASPKRPGSGPPSARGPGPGGSSSGGWGSEAAATPGGEASGDSSGEVNPIPVYSEKELTSEIDKLAEHLRHPTDWAVRSAAIRRLQGLVLGGACEYPSFTSHLKSLREPLVAQCSELRSSLVREVCALLVLVSSTLREGFEPFCVEYFPPLLKQSAVTIQIIREASNECIRALIIYALPARLAPKILEAVRDRSATLRKNAVEYLLLLLDALPAYAEGERCPLEKHADAIATEIKKLLTDALAEVRATSRTALWAFHRHFPSRTARLLPLLDASTHKLVLEEQHHYEKARQNGEGPSIRGLVHGGSRGVVVASGNRSGSTPGLRQQSSGGTGSLLNLGRQSSASSTTSEHTSHGSRCPSRSSIRRRRAQESSTNLGGSNSSIGGGGFGTARRSTGPPPGQASARRSESAAVRDERPVGPQASAREGGYAAQHGACAENGRPSSSSSAAASATPRDERPVGPSRTQSLARQQQQAQQKEQREAREREAREREQREEEEAAHRQKGAPQEGRDGGEGDGGKGGGGATRGGGGGGGGGRRRERMSTMTRSTQLARRSQTRTCSLFSRREAPRCGPSVPRAATSSRH